MEDKTNHDLIEINENNNSKYVETIKVTKINDNNFRAELTIREDQYDSAKTVITDIVYKARLGMSLDNNPIHFNVRVKGKADPFILTGDLISIKLILIKYSFISEETLFSLNDQIPNLPSQATANEKQGCCCTM